MTLTCLVRSLQVMQQLDGEWRLVYTSSSPLISILALGKLPLISVGDILQTINSSTSTVENKVDPEALNAGTAARACQSVPGQ